MKVSLAKHLVYLFSFVIFSFFITTPVNAAHTTIFNIPTDYKDIGVPQDMYVDEDNNIWFADSQGYRIIKIDQSGNILRTIGRQGNDNGEFITSPMGITADDEGLIYVLEYQSCRVVKFDQNGGYISSWGGSCGTENYDFNEGKGIVYDATSDTLLISDTLHDQVIRYTKNGEYISKFGTNGTGDGDLDGPSGIDVDSSGNIYVVDGENHRVEVFDSEYNFLFKFGTVDDGDYQLIFPKDVDVLANGNIAVTSQNSYVVKIFSSNGTYIRTISEYGSGDGQSFGPHYIASDPLDNIYITDYFLNRIQKFSDLGVFDWKFGNSSPTDNRLVSPNTMAYSADGKSYVLDSGRVQRFSQAGAHEATLIDTGELHSGSYFIALNDSKIYVTYESGIQVFDLTGEKIEDVVLPEGDSFNHARGIAFDSLGNCYVADYYGQRIVILDTNMDYVSEFSTKYNTDHANPWGVSIYNDEIYVALNTDPSLATEGHDHHLIAKYNTSGVLQDTIMSAEGEGQALSTVFMAVVNALNGYVYVSDLYSNSVKVYESDFDFVESIGEYGSGELQFSEPNGIAINPITQTLSVVDKYNHRVQLLGSGVKIKNLIPSNDVLRSTDDFSLVKQYLDPVEDEVENIQSEMYFGDYIVSDFTVDLTTDRDWEEVNAISLPDYSKAILIKLNPTDAPGVSETHSLYLSRKVGQNYVRVCPSANTLDEITLTCEGGYTLSSGDENLTELTIDSKDYWKVSGLTGTGAMSYAIEDLRIEILDSDVKVNEKVDIRVTALNSEEITDTTYRGTVTFTSQTGATLPSSYEFLAKDNGVHVFDDKVWFDRAGTFTITVTDSIDGVVKQSGNIVVTAVSTNQENNQPIVYKNTENVEEQTDEEENIEEEENNTENPIDTIVDDIDNTVKETVNNKSTSWIVWSLIFGIPILIVLLLLFLARRKEE